MPASSVLRGVTSLAVAVIATLAQLVGLAVIVAAGFMLGPVVGVAALGAVLVLIGTQIERPRDA